MIIPCIYIVPIIHSCELPENIIPHDQPAKTQYPMTNQQKIAICEHWRLTWFKRTRCEHGMPIIYWQTRKMIISFYRNPRCLIVLYDVTFNKVNSNIRRQIPHKTISCAAILRLGWRTWNSVPQADSKPVAACVASGSDPARSLISILLVARSLIHMPLAARDQYAFH